jgi:hypothetical protein
MSSTEVPVRAVAPSRVALGVVIAIVVAVVVNTGIAFATGTQTGLLPVAYGPLTAIGILAATGGWAVVRRRAARPRAVLRVLVPVVFLVSLVPGVVLLAVGNGAINVVGLWVMHVVVTVVTVTMLSRAMPVSD